MTGEFILAATGAPFGDPDAANIKRRMLVAELGVEDDAFVVVPHPDGGYAVVRGGVVDGDAFAPASEPVSDRLPAGPGDAARARTSPARHPSPSAPGTRAVPRTEGALNTGLIEPDVGDPYPPAFVLNVSPRAFLDRYVLIAAGVLLVLAPWGAVFPSIGPGTLGGQATWMLRLCGLVLALWNMGRFMYSYLFFTYEVTAEGAVARRGPLSRATPHLSFARVRATKVEQAFWERLLGVGAVRVHTEETGTPAFRFSHIADPARFDRDVHGRCQSLRSASRHPAY